MTLDEFINLPRGTKVYYIHYPFGDVQYGRSASYTTYDGEYETEYKLRYKEGRGFSVKIMQQYVNIADLYLDKQTVIDQHMEIVAELHADLVRQAQQTIAEL